jgi:hypothetical protein
MTAVNPAANGLSMPPTTAKATTSAMMLRSSWSGEIRGFVWKYRAAVTPTRKDDRTNTATFTRTTLTPIAAVASSSSRMLRMNTPSRVRMVR